MEIGEWVIEEACRAAATWPEQITVALNISPKQLILPALPNIVSEALAPLQGCRPTGSSWK